MLEGPEFLLLGRCRTSWGWCCIAGQQSPAYTAHNCFRHLYLTWKYENQKPAQANGLQVYRYSLSAASTSAASSLPGTAEKDAANGWVGGKKKGGQLLRHGFHCMLVICAVEGLISFTFLLQLVWSYLSYSPLKAVTRYFHSGNKEVRSYLTFSSRFFSCYKFLERHSDAF